MRALVCARVLSAAVGNRQYGKKDTCFLSTDDGTTTIHAHTNNARPGVIRPSSVVPPEDYYDDGGYSRRIDTAAILRPIPSAYALKTRATEYRRPLHGRDPEHGGPVTNANQTRLGSSRRRRDPPTIEANNRRPAEFLVIARRSLPRT